MFVVTSAGTLAEFYWTGAKWIWRVYPSRARARIPPAHSLTVWPS